MFVSTVCFRGMSFGSYTAVYIHDDTYVSWELSRSQENRQWMLQPFFFYKRKKCSSMGRNPEKYFFLVSIFWLCDSKFYVIVISQVPMACLPYLSVWGTLLSSWTASTVFLSKFSSKSSAVLLHYERWYTIRNTHRDELCPKNEITIAPIRATQKELFFSSPSFLRSFCSRLRGATEEEREQGGERPAAARRRRTSRRRRRAALRRRSSDRRSGGRRRGQCPYEECDFFRRIKRVHLSKRNFQFEGKELLGYFYLPLRSKVRFSSSLSERGIRCTVS